MADYYTPVDIGNRALIRVGYDLLLTTLTDNSKAAKLVNFNYDKLRKAELRRNVWTFATRRTMIRPYNSTCLQFVPEVYNAAKTYIPGSIVSYANQVYEATQAVPLATPPDVNSTSSVNPYTASAYWQIWFGSPMVSQWSYSQQQGGPSFWVSTTSYAAQTQVIGSDGNEYYSLINGNLNNNPVTDGGVHWGYVGVAPTGQGYLQGELVYYPLGANPGIYRCMNQNLNLQPGSTPAWVSTQTYAQFQTVTYGGVVYQSTEPLNVGNTPTGTGAWVTIPSTQTNQMEGSNWLLLGAASLIDFQINYPANSGPSTDEATRNVFILPNGFLRPCSQDPKAGIISYLGAPSERRAVDWTYENGYLISSYFTPIPYRFVADVQNVGEFDAMFCEGLAMKLAKEICEPLTQSTEKLQMIQADYKTIMGEARIVDGIEAGATQQPLDDYIACRV